MVDNDVTYWNVVKKVSDCNDRSGVCF